MVSFEKKKKVKKLNFDIYQPDTYNSNSSYRKQLSNNNSKLSNNKYHKGLHNKRKKKYMGSKLSDAKYYQIQPNYKQHQTYLSNTKTDQFLNKPSGLKLYPNKKVKKSKLKKKMKIDQGEGQIEYVSSKKKKHLLLLDNEVKSPAKGSSKRLNNASYKPAFQ